MIPLLQYDDLYQYDLPDQKSILQAAVRVATRNGDVGVLPTLSVALARVDAALALEAAWRVASTPTVERRTALEFDQEADGLLGDLYRTFSTVADNRLHPFRAAAAALLRECFPRGLGAHVQEDYADEIEMTAAVVGVLRLQANEDVVRALSLSPTVDALAEVNESLRASLVVDTSITRAAVTAAAAKALRATRWAVYLVLGSFDPDDEASCVRRDEALAQLRAVQGKLRERHVMGPRKKAEDCAPPAAPKPPSPTDAPPAADATPVATADPPTQDSAAAK